MGTDKPAGAMPALSEFLTETTFGGWVSASYFYNLNNPDNGSSHDVNQGTGRNGIANAYHGDSNSFHVDEVWFEISNDATAESRGGFQVDVLMGETADVMCGDRSFGYEYDDEAGEWFSTDDSDSDDDNGNDPCLYNANVSYLAPITDNGIEITAGRFGTHIGSERPGAPYNFNITRGMVWNLQPIAFTGVKIESKYDSGIDWMLGVSNTSGYEGGGFAQQTDFDDEKTFLWRVGYQASDTMSIAFNGLYGGNCATTGDPQACDGPDAKGDSGNSSDKQVVMDVILDWNPSDRLSTWLNVDYIWTIEEDRDGDPRVLGIAAAGRYAVTDATGFALRAEYIRAWDNYLEIPFENSLRADHDLWSVTATVDHKLTDHLTVKAEVVYQEGNSEDNHDEQFFAGDNIDEASQLEENQILLGVQMTYEF
jgi:hypothetical protein